MPAVGVLRRSNPHLKTDRNLVNWRDETNALYQSFTDTAGPARGRVEFRPGTRTRIVLGTRADKSTVLHELGHVFLEDLFGLAGQAGGLVRGCDPLA